SSGTRYAWLRATAMRCGACAASISTPAGATSSTSILVLRPSPRSSRGTGSSTHSSSSTVPTGASATGIRGRSANWCRLWHRLLDEWWRLRLPVLLRRRELAGDSRRSLDDFVVEQPLAQTRGRAGLRRPRRAVLAELDAAIGGQVEQLLALLVLDREAVEQPSQQDGRQHHLLDHHQAAGQVLIRERTDGVAGVSELVRPVEDGRGPDQDVAEQCAGEADRNDVAERAPALEPFGLGERPDQGQPEQRTEPEEGCVLEGVDQVKADRCDVENRQVPGIEVGCPQDECDKGVGELSQRTGWPEVQQR